MDKVLASIMVKAVFLGMFLCTFYASLKNEITFE